MRVGFDIEVPLFDAKTRKLILPYEDAGISRLMTGIPEDNVKKRRISCEEKAFVHTDGVMLELNPKPFSCRVHSYWTLLDCIQGGKQLVEKALKRSVVMLPIPVIKLPKRIL